MYLYLIFSFRKQILQGANTALNFLYFKPLFPKGHNSELPKGHNSDFLYKLSH